MFYPNKYTSWYFSIINNATHQNRSKGSIYYESHHIIPKSLGGNDRKDNKVLLTPKEHYVCHLLLPKMCKSGSHKAKMVYAFMMFNGKTKVKYRSRIYQIMKNHYSKIIKGANSVNYGKKHSFLTKSKISQSRIGKYAGSDNGMYGKTHTPEVRQRLSQINRGKQGTKHSEDHKAKLRSHNPGAIVTRKQVYQFNLDGTLFATHESWKAAVASGVKRSTLSANIKPGGLPVNGYFWRYAPSLENGFDSLTERRRTLDANQRNIRQIQQLDINGQVVATYPSITEASRLVETLGGNYSMLYKCITSNRNYCGFKWTYI